MDRAALRPVCIDTVRKQRRNGDLRTREYLTEHEVERLIETAKRNRHGHRDTTMGLVAYRHGLRAAELVDLRWDQVDFKTATLHVRRVKQGTPSTHPILGDELRALRRLQREQDKSTYVFTSERGAPFGTAGFARMVEQGQAWVQSSPAHAKARLRLRLGQPGPRYASATSVPRAQKYPAHGALHRVVIDPVQELLARITVLNHVRYSPKSGHWGASARCPLYPQKRT